MPRAQANRREGGAELLSRREAAEYLGVAEKTLAIWKVTGRQALPVVKVGRLAKYRRSDLDRFLSSSTFEPQQKACTPPIVGQHAPKDSRAVPARPTQPSVEFAELRLVEQQPHQVPARSLDETIASVEVIFPNGIKLRLGPNCPSDLVQSVLALLESR